MRTNLPHLAPFRASDPPPSCARWRNHMPRYREIEPYRLYIEARKRWRSKVEWQFTREELLNIFQDVEMAAKSGDWGARALLAHFYLEGLGPIDSNHILDPNPEKYIEILRAAVAAGQPWAYYDIGVAHENGYAGMPHDEQLAWAYYLKAAEMGSPDAQVTLASAYGAARRWEDEKTMLLCAYNQGHGKAAHRLGIYAKLDKKFAEALRFYQDGTKFGNADSAAALMVLFEPEGWRQRTNEDRAELTRLAILPDGRRSDLYLQISQALKVNPDFRLDRLDDVLPLPPASLPEWRGIQPALTPEPAGPPTY